MIKKIAFVLTAVLFIISSTCTVLGFLHKNNKATTNAITYTIQYKYYLDDEIVEEMPVNADELQYEFDKYSCSGGIQGNFDESEWKFIPDKNNVNGVCSLYFVNSFYNVELFVTNGVSEEESPIKIKRNEDAEIIVNPIEGYQYSSSTCSSQKSGNWDSSTNKFVINDITSDIACKIVFEIKTVSIQLQVKNGTGSINEDLKYGDSFQAIVEPYVGYENPSISCTNNQQGIFNKNQFNVEKLTSDTICKVIFKKVKPVSYNVSFSINENDKNSIIFHSGSITQSIVSGSTASVIIETSDKEPKVSCQNNIIPIIEKNESSYWKIEFQNVSSNINCNLSLE